MAKLIHRVTMLKLSGAENQAKLLAAYEKMSKEQSTVLSKDGKPYVEYLCAGVAQDDSRARGYTVVVQTVFRSMEDMKYYQDECAAHQELIAYCRELGVSEAPMTVYFEGTPIVDFTKA